MATRLAKALDTDYEQKQARQTRRAQRGLTVHEQPDRIVATGKAEYFSIAKKISEAEMLLSFIFHASASSARLPASRPWATCVETENLVTLVIPPERRLNNQTSSARTADCR